MHTPRIFFFFFFNDTATTEIYTLSLHDALPICSHRLEGGDDGEARGADGGQQAAEKPDDDGEDEALEDRKSTRLNSSHVRISYAVFCLKKKTITNASVYTSSRCILIVL